VPSGRGREGHRRPRGPSHVLLTTPEIREKTAVLDVVIFEEEDEARFVGLLQVEAA
jgi:hypothetical protein